MLSTVPFVSPTVVFCFVGAYVVVGFVVKAALRMWHGRQVWASTRAPAAADPHWLFGNVVQIILKNGTRRHDYVTSLLQQRRTQTLLIRGLSVAAPTVGWAPPNRLVTIDPAVVRHILADKYNAYIKKMSYIYGFHKLLGNGIFSVDHGPHASDGGASWRWQRKAAARIFTRNNFRSTMKDVFVANGRLLADIIGSAAANGVAVDIQDLFFRYTMDSIGQIGFGVQMGTMARAKVGGYASGGTPGATAAAERISDRAHTFAKNFDEAHRRMMLFKNSLVMRLIIDLLPSPFSAAALALFMRFDANACAFSAAVRALDSFSLKLIRQRRAEGTETLAAKSDLLALFMREAGATSNSSTDKVGAIPPGLDAGASTAPGKGHATDRQLRDVVMSFIIAGRDTTACLLSWTAVILATHPHIAAKVRTEVAAALPDLQEPTFETAGERQLPYLNAVLKEALRLYPPVPQDGKVAAVDDTLPDGTHVPRGTIVAYFPWGMGRSEHIWGSDASDVRPERWLGGGPIVGPDGVRRQPTSFEFPVFQAGPRICLGMNMAMLEASVATAMLAQRFKFRLADPERTHTYNSLGLTMSVNGGVRVFAEPI